MFFTSRLKFRFSRLKRQGELQIITADDITEDSISEKRKENGFDIQIEEKFIYITSSQASLLVKNAHKTVQVQAFDTPQRSPTCQAPMDLIKVTFADQDFWILKHILQYKAPKFLEANRKSSKSNEIVIKGKPMECMKYIPIIFEYWLKNNTLPKIPEVTKAHDNVEVIKGLLTSTLWVYIIAEEYNIPILMDHCMDTLTKTTAWNTCCTMNVKNVVFYYNRLSGPCGLRLFMIRLLIPRLDEISKCPEDLELISRHPGLMAAFFREMAAQGYAADVRAREPTAKKPKEYLLGSYLHEKFLHSRCWARS